MGYICAKCDGCGVTKQFDGCIEVVLEFVMPDTGESIFVQGDWHGFEEKKYVASFYYEGPNEIGDDQLAAVPKWLRFKTSADGKTTVPDEDGPTLSRDQLPAELTLGPDIHAIFDRVYCSGLCFGAGYNSADGWGLMEFHQAQRASMVGLGPSHNEKERYCAPKGVAVHQFLTDDHIRRLRYCTSRFSNA